MHYQPPKRGLSIEEKRTRLLSWFQEHHSVYNIKEIESIASKKTGISSMQIKDILKMLTDDNLVECEKCGISNLYWSFKYAAKLKLQEQYGKGLCKREQLQESIEEAQAKLLILTETRDGEHWNQLNEQYKSLQESNNQLKGEHQELMETSIDNVAGMEKQILELDVAIDSIEDNIDLIINYFHKQNGIDKTELKRMLNIPEDL